MKVHTKLLLQNMNCSVFEFNHEHLDPKDGDLCLNNAKSEKTLCGCL